MTLRPSLSLACKNTHTRLLPSGRYKAIKYHRQVYHACCGSSLLFLFTVYLLISFFFCCCSPSPLSLHAYVHICSSCYQTLNINVFFFHHDTSFHYNIVNVYYSKMFFFCFLYHPFLPFASYRFFFCNSMLYSVF